MFDVDASRGVPDGFALSVEPPRREDLSQRINALLADLRAGRASHAGCYVVRQGAPRPPPVPDSFLGFQG